MSKVTAEVSSEEQDDSLSPLMERLESAIHRLNLASEDLSDLAVEVPAGEHGSAAFVVAEVMKELNQLYRDLHVWESTHEYTPRDMQPLIEHLREIEMEPGSNDESIDTMLHGRTVLRVD